MADDQSQRPYRASEPPARGAAKVQGSDPLAELARLIGQTDPFAEFGREAARRAPAPQSDAHADWNMQPATSPYTGQTAPADARMPTPAQRAGGSNYFAARSTPAEQPLTEPQGYGAQSYGSQSYDSSPRQGDDLYQTENEARGYPPGETDYQEHDAAYEQDSGHFTDDTYYDDVPTSRRRTAVMAIAGVLALAVIGTAGAFGYRAIFGSSGSTQPPPVIKAETGPSKIVPATTGKDTQSSKLITDRLSERGQSERLVSREEQPIDKPATAVLSQGSQQAPLGSGVVASEPKKVRTIVIHPDQPVMADATPVSAPLATAAAPTTAPAAVPTRAAPPPVARPAAPPPAARPGADNSTADAEPGPGPAPATRPAPPARQAAPAPSNAPLSLNPNAPPARAPARPAPAPARTASVAAPAQIAPAAAPRNGTAGGHGSFVQVSSQRSEAEAQAAFRSLQAKYPTQLGGKQPQIHRVDLGAKGIYFRAMVGPFANASEATELCSSLKAAGGQCLIQRN